MMKNNIINQYSQLINDMKVAHDKIVTDLWQHINLLEKENLELKDERAKREIEKQVKESNKETEAKKSVKKPAKKPSSKKGSFLVTCQVCGKSFFAKSKTAKYCKACRKEKNREYQRKWQAKRGK